MPAPQSLTGVPDDPQKSLPNPQSYDASDPDIVIDQVTHLVWQKAVASAVMTWSQADSYCAALDLAGRRDWRLPARIELVSLIDFTQARLGNVNADAFPNPPRECVWACSSTPSNPLWAWIVDFSNGGSGWAEKVTPCGVRCVAGSRTATPPPERYDLHTRDEVHDLKTLLSWRAAAAPGPVSWGQAYDYCLGLGTGWRLPSTMELQTLIDQTRVLSAVDPTAFPGSPDDYFWTSSIFDNTPTQAWFVSIGAGNTYWLSTTEAHRARCVR
jgi:uncharacterized protein DUF1566